jgi:glycosyltransferase involved in cell wall biosynthesis
MGLKILHVGNIAQNGYINASILRARGHDCDLVAPDLLHAGSSPEWYELSTGDVDPSLFGDDPFFPDFYALGRAMPEVGDWVAHGPFLPALIYLLLKRRGDPRAHMALAVLWYLRFKMTVQRTTDPLAVPMGRDAFEAHLARYDLRPRLRRRILLGRMAEDYWNDIVARVRLQEDSAYVNGWRPPLSCGTLDIYSAADPGLDGLLRGLRKRGLAEALFIEFSGPWMDYAHTARHGFTTEEAIPYLWTGRILRELVSCYDVGIFYGDTCKFAFAAGIEGYWALEHGTIRTLPFEPNANGRMVAAGFLNARRVFLTNTDYASAEPRLEFAPEQRVYFPHPFDEALAVAFRRAHPRVRDPERIVFFCPARQDWRSGDPKMAKGNDLYIRAGKMLRDRGRSNFAFHCIDWGIDRDATRELVAELGLVDHVRWSPLMPKGKLWAAMLDVHAVVDQFLISAFGASTVEAFAIGCRLISRDDGINNGVFFAEPPPILAAATAEEIALQMAAVMDDPEDLAGLGDRGIAWVQRYHSADRIHELQLAAFGGVPGCAMAAPHGDTAFG